MKPIVDVLTVGRIINVKCTCVIKSWSTVQVWHPGLSELNFEYKIYARKVCNWFMFWKYYFPCNWFQLLVTAYFNEFTLWESFAVFLWLSWTGFHITVLENNYHTPSCYLAHWNYCNGANSKNIKNNQILNLFLFYEKTWPN